MVFSKKAAALAAGVVAAVSLASLAQEPAQPQAPSDHSRQIVVGGSIDWVEKSDVSALKEGVIAHIELEVGRTVKKGQEIGYLYDKMAELTEAKAKLASENVGEIKKAEAQRELALASLARISRLKVLSGNQKYVSDDEEQKAKAEFSVANALLTSAKEGQNLAKADYDLAIQARKEHHITAPFDGVITDRMKNPGESVRSNEPVVRIGRTNKLRFVGWVSLEVAYRIKGNEVIDVRPMIEGSDLPIEQKKFRGKVTDVSREVSTLRATEVRILGEIDNPEKPDHPELELRQGMKAEMTIYLDAGAAKVAAKP
jgi:RND family efflux transporter MFP subunit